MTFPCWRTFGVAAFIALAGCVPSPSVEHSAERDLLADSRRIATEVKQRFAAALSHALDAGNILRSFSVCRYDAPEILSDMSRTMGMRVARVSLHPRNPAIAAADAWEQRVLNEFQWRHRAGESSGMIEHAEYVEEPAGRVYRYMVAVPVQPQCMYCHGPETALTAAVRAKIASEYPASSDKSSFEVGGLAGAISVIQSW